ncbi:MAG TPA: hypothetical protein VMV47_10425 [Bacteroidales bacterium]|nr:hypothetical protein [Bacteroidales bacterium]
MNNTNRYGYSLKIDDPAMARYIRDTKRWSAIFSLILAVVAVAGFFIYGETSSEMDNPESLYIGIGIGSMFILIALFQISGRNRSITWDGIVVDKVEKSKSRYDKYQSRWEEYLEFTVSIQADNGKMHYIGAEDDDTLYNYYQIGNRVRHHKGLNSYEKQDKSGDTIIFCNACASLNDI